MNAPDNRAAWDRISAEYQDKHRLKTDTPHYGPRLPTEADLKLTGDVGGKHVLEIGCGGGQCAIAFARQGAFAAGIDQSAAQIEYARRLAAADGVTVEFHVGDAARLPQIASESQDVVFSAHALSYVEDIGSCFGEVARVLKTGGVFVFSTGHPLWHILSEDGSMRVERPYWGGFIDWEWGQEGSGVWMRSWDRNVETWFSLLRGAGFIVDRILEPKMLEQAHDESWDDSYALAQGLMVPNTIIFRALKPSTEGG